MTAVTPRVWQCPDGTLVVHEDSPSYGRDTMWIAGQDQPPADAVALLPATTPGDDRGRELAAAATDGSDPVTTRDVLLRFDDESVEAVAHAEQCVRDVRDAVTRWKVDGMRSGDLGLLVEGAEAWCDSVRNRLDALRIEGADRG